MRAIKAKIGEDVSGGGRPEKSKIVEELQQLHPDGTKAEFRAYLKRRKIIKYRRSHVRLSQRIHCFMQWKLSEKI